MKLSENQLQEIKTFLEENLCQDIDINLIESMKLNEALSNFFNFNLEPYISPDTTETVRAFIKSLKQ